MNNRLGYVSQRHQLSASSPAFAPIATALAELCWLAAVATLPLSVQLMAEGPYSDSKTALTSAYGLSMWACIALAPRDLWARILQLKAPIALAVGLLAISVTSHYFALDSSAWSHHRDVASLRLTELAPQVGLFLGVCLFLRTPEQLQRLATSVIATSFAVALVAVTETFGLINPDHGKDSLWTIVSFVGSGLSVGSYLAFCLPLSVWWLWWQMQKSGSRLSAQVLLGVLVVLVQLIAIFGANKRGPMVALLVAVVLAAILLRQKKATFFWIVRMGLLGLVVGGTLTALALYGRWQPEFRKTPVVGKLSMVVPVGEGTGDTSRDKIWAAAMDVFSGKTPVKRPDGEPDNFLTLRPWLGLGPDSAVLALASGYLMLGRWPSSALEMSTHNHMLDVLLTLGVVGLLLFLAFYIVVFARGFRHLFGSPSNLPRAWLIGASTTSLVAFSAALIWGRGYFVAGIQAGLLATFALFALLAERKVGAGQPAEVVRKLYVALLIGAASYWTYLCFMFPTTPGMALFLIAAGAIVGFAEAGKMPKAEFPASTPPAPNVSPYVWFCYVGSLILVSIIASRSSIYPILSGEADYYALFTSSLTNTAVVACLLLVAWRANAVLLNGGDLSQQSVRRGMRTTAAAAIAAAVFFVLFSAFARSIPLPLLADLTAMQVFLPPVAGLCVVFAISARSSSFFSGPAKVTTAICVFLVTVCLMIPVANNMRAAVAAGYAKRFNLPYDHALAVRMVGLAPMSMQYRQLRLHLLDAHMRATTPYSADWLRLHASRTQLMEEIEKLSRFSLNSAHLGRAYLEKHEMTRCQVEQERLLQNAASSLRSSLNFMPRNEMALVDLAFVHAARGEKETSRKYLQLADAITGKASPATEGANYLGWWTYYYDLASKTHGKPRRMVYAQRAVKYLDAHLHEIDAAIAGSIANSPPSVRGLTTKGWLHSARGEMWRTMNENKKAALDFALASYYWAFAPTPDTIELTARRAVETTNRRPMDTTASPPR